MCGELASLRVGDIDIERQVLVVRQGKGAKDRIIPLSKSTCIKLTDYIQNKDKGSSLFGLASATISGKIRSFANKAGVNIHTHSLRDYFATSLSEKGATIREIQTLLGHSNLTHTERYTLHTDKHLKDAIDLIDKEPDDKQSVKSERYITQEQLQQQPIVTLRVIDKLAVPVNDNVLRNDFFSHFIARNEAQNPIVEIELSLLNDENRVLEICRESVLGTKEDIIFKPIPKISEGNYKLVCLYKELGSKYAMQTILPFKVSKASKFGEIFVLPGKLELNCIT